MSELGNLSRITLVGQGNIGLCLAGLILFAPHITKNGGSELGTTRIFLYI
jgi:hypothetical protein